MNRTDKTSISPTCKHDSYLGIDLPKDLKTRIKKVAKSNNLKMAAQVRVILYDWLENNPQ